MERMCYLEPMRARQLHAHLALLERLLGDVAVTQGCLVFLHHGNMLQAPQLLGRERGRGGRDAQAKAQPGVVAQDLPEQLGDAVGGSGRRVTQPYTLREGTRGL